MAKKISNTADIIRDIMTNVTAKHFPEITLDNNLVSINGFITESEARAINDTMTLENTRASEYSPELSSSPIRVRETAKIWSIPTKYASPGKCFAILGVLKSDILDKGTTVGVDTTFTIDRRSNIVYSGINFSLEDDVVVRATKRGSKYIYSVSYAGERASYESYIQAFEQTNSQGEELVAMLCQVYQYNYNIQDKVVTDSLEFLYEGLSFDYDDKMCGFEVYYKKSYSEGFRRVSTDHHLTTATAKGIFYNDDDDNILKIYNNPALNINVNSTIRVEIRETLGSEGFISINDNDVATFSIYRDSAYNYSGVNISVNMLSDTVGASDGDNIADIKSRLIDAKTRRNNITTEHDVISYINDVDANVQIIKKRNDVEDRSCSLYTMIRHGTKKEVAPTTTKRLNLVGVKSETDLGDFDRYDATVDRKVLRARNKFLLNVVPGTPDNDFVTKVPFNTVDNLTNYYLTCPYTVIIDTNNIASYYYSSVNSAVTMSMQPIVEAFPFQFLCRTVDIYRDSHSAETADVYSFTIRGTLNTANDDELVDPEGKIKDKTAIMSYLVFNRENTPCSYMSMAIDSYDIKTREFAFVGTFKTSDYITEQDKLEIPTGLFEPGTLSNYGSVIDFKDAQFRLFFMYKFHDPEGHYQKTDPAYNTVVKAIAENYVLMCSYQNNNTNLYNLVFEFNKFSRSPVQVTKDKDGIYHYSLGEVPFFEFKFGVAEIANLYDTFRNITTVYGSLLRLTSDFEVSLKFTATYGPSKYITVTGGRGPSGEEITQSLNNLNPVLAFKIYGNNVPLSQISDYIYSYLRETYIIGSTIFISNICTAVEKQFSSVRSIKYMGIDSFDASYQELTYNAPDLVNLDIVSRYVPEELNVMNIQLKLDEN